MAVRVGWWEQLGGPGRRRTVSYFLPAEGASDQAESLFSFDSLAEYERYRTRFGTDRELVAADRIRDDSGCVLRYERTFMRPLLPTN